MYNPFSFRNWQPVVYRQPSPSLEVALSLDDGPTPDTTPRVLELLARAGAKATFFLTGTRVAAHPGLVADLVAGGHDVFGHGWDHIDLVKAGPQRAVDDMRRVESLLARHRPTPATYLVRLPFNAGVNRAWMHRAMAAFHPDVRFAWCSVNTHDYEFAAGCRSMGELQARASSVAHQLRTLPSLPGSILLLHEAPIGALGTLVPQIAEVFLPMVLSAIAERGLQAAPIRLDPARSPRRRLLFVSLAKVTDLRPAPIGDRPAGPLSTRPTRGSGCRLAPGLRVYPKS